MTFSRRIQVKESAILTFKLFKALPSPEKIMQIRYEFQENRKLIGTDEFTFNAHTFQKNCDFVEEFWIGKREAIPVGRKNKWKCGFCEFQDICKERPSSPDLNISER